MHVKHLDHLNLYVRDFAETAEWYGRVLGFEVVERGSQDGQPWGVIRGGDAMLCIYQSPERRQADGGERQRLMVMNHFALRIADRAAWQATLDRENLHLGYGSPIHWDHSTSWYITDPNGYEIEIALWDRDQVAFS